MEKILYLYTYIDGVNDTPFPNQDEKVVVSEFRGDYKRMGAAPTISCTVMHHKCLDKLWTDNVYTTFNGEKFFIKQTASSSYDNSDSRYKHEVELVSERIILDNVYFYDVVQSDVTNDKPVSNSSNVVFFGDIHEFANRLNYSLQYSNVGYSVVVDDGISSEGKMMSFQNQFFSNVLQEIYNTYEIPYYFVGKVIHIGYTNNAITHTFKYGVDESLLSIQKQNANYKVVNRVTGIGSADNIPYYYPNDYESKEEVEANGGTWINPQPKLMPSIYRETLGEERFYKALNNTYVSPQTGEYYYFENPFVEGKPKEHIVDFENIKPSIKGMLNASNHRMDMFVDFAYDAEDNDETDDEGNYLHPYFFAKLRKFDGDYGFNLFDHAIDEQEMVISMTSGSCGACEWVIGVDEESQKNTVQVNSSGNLVRDDKGNIKFGTPQDRQNDTRNYEVWIALKKDINTFGVIMPNASSNYKPSVNDTFVILHIDLPKAYILSAENNLKEQLIKYMAMNNSERFTFSISFSRIFFAENPQILAQLNENARIQIEYDNTYYELYVSSYSYNMSNGSPLPEIKVELSDTLSVQQNALQNAISEVKQDIMSSVGSVDWLKLGLKYFLRKDTDDKTKYSLAVGRNLTVGEQILSNDFAMGEFGNGFILKYDKQTGQSYFEVDRMLVRKVAYFVELVIKQLSHVGGQLVLSPASMRCSRVEEYEEFYRCYFESERDGKTINNEFRVNDQARAQSFNIKEGVSHNVSNQYYWRLVVGTGDDYIDLSKIDCDEGSLPPLAGDDIVQLGNRTDTERQNAIILSTIGEDAPSFKQYEGIQYYTFAGKEVTVISPKGNVITGDFLSKSGKELLSYIDDLGARLDMVQYQTDKSYDIWFYPYVPSLDNYPASEWIDDAGRREHVQDIFYNEDSGRAYRFLEPSVGVFEWVEITDHETIKALEKASKAQETADSKIRNFVTQPVPPYEVGDRWSNASYGDLYVNDDLVCIVSRGEGESFAISDWKLSSEVGTKKFTSEIKRLDDEILLRVTSKDVDGKISEAGVQIKADIATLYATKATVDSINGRVTTAEAQISVNATNIESKVSKNGVISSINQSSESVTINANKINLNGVVTFSMLSGDMQNTINAKANANSLGSLAYQNSVGKAMLDSTIISGGYINTSLIDVNTLVAKKVVTNGDSFGVITTMADGEISMKTSSSVQLLRIYSNGSSSRISLKDNSSNSILLNPISSSFSFSNGKYLSINSTNGIEFSGGMGVKRFAISSIMTSLSADGDLCIIGDNYTMPNAIYLKGRVMWVYATREVTLTGSFMNSNGSSASSISCHGMNFFISNGSNWYRGYCQ